MHTKLVLPSAWDFGLATAELVKVAQGRLVGTDYGVLVKRAGEEFAHLVRNMSIPPDELPVHIIAMGATEAFGPNRNADGFKEAMLRRTHKTFEKHAKVYRHHKNTDPSQSYGVIKFAHYNEAMRRVELLLALNKNAEAAKRNGGLIADKEIEKLASGQDMAGSMACFLSERYPILTRDRGYVGIGQIKVGDYVWTHAGRWRKVTQLNRRKYTGEVFKFKMNGLPAPIEITGDHPMWAKVFAGSRERSALKAKAARFFKDTAAFDKQPAGWTHAAHLGVGDRFFYKPVTRYNGYGRIVDIDLATVMGYYLAEGSFGYNGDRACTTQFACHINDSLPRRLPQIMERLAPDVTVDIEVNRTSPEVGLVVNVHNTPFSEFLRKYVGRGCKRKLIAPEIFNSTEEVKLAYLGAWLDGDGWLDKKGVHWSSASRGLLLQGRDLLATMGVPASIYRIDHRKCKTSGYKGSSVEYTLNISHLDAWKLSGYSQKTADYPSPKLSRKQPASMRYCPDGTYAYRISKVSSRFVSEQIVYNFEVEEDESYSAAGLISHNCRVPFDVCSVCSHKARHRGEYCESVKEGGSCPGFGCKQGLARVLENGHIQHVDNPDGVFFDYSHVHKPADRNAYGNIATYLQKAASAGRALGGSELAELLEVTTPLWLRTGELEPWVERQVKIAYQLAEIETILEADPALLQQAAPAFLPAEPLDIAPLGTLGSEKAASGLAALASQQILLPLSEFVCWLVGGDREKAAELTSAVSGSLPGIYSRLIASGSLEADIAGSPFRPSLAAVPPAQRQWAAKCAAAYSWTAPAVFQRAARSAIHNLAPAAITVKRAGVAEKWRGVAGQVEALACHYALYKLAALAAQSQELPLTAHFAACQNYIVR